MNTISVDINSSGMLAYRVVPDPNDPVILQIDGQLCRVAEISASGFSCVAAEIKQGRRYQFKLGLPTVSTELAGYVDVLPGNENGILQCQFVDLSADELDMLHHYVLVRQKEVIRSLKSGSLPRH